jgi:ComF family protein
MAVHWRSLRMAAGKRATIGLQTRELLRHLRTAAQRSSAAALGGLSSGLTAAGKFRRATLDLVFPAACAGCQAEFAETPPHPNIPLCGACLDEIELIDGPTCRQCGAPVPHIGRDTDRPVAVTRPGGCPRCRGRKLWFDETIAAGVYGGRLRELLLRMKRVEGDGLSLAIGQLVWQQCAGRLAASKADVVVPVPLHWRRRLAHLTNSAAVLGEVLARQLQLPLAERLLRRQRHTKPQASVTPTQRWENVRRAFSVRGGYHLNDAHVLLVDDILTTGATCSEAARALRNTGAARITVVVAARAIH